MILYSKNLLKGALDFSYYETFLTEESLYDSKWLFYYECCINGWLGKDKNNQYVKDDKFFGQLLNYDISFVNPNYSRVREEVENSIISLCLKYYSTSMKNFAAQDIIIKALEKYSFSLEGKLIEEIKRKLEIEISKTEEPEGADEGTEEPEGADEGTEESEGADEGTEEPEGAEGTEESSEVARTQSNNNTWLFNFLRTNINNTSHIRTFEIDDEY